MQIAGRFILFLVSFFHVVENQLKMLLAGNLKGGGRLEKIRGGLLLMDGLRVCVRRRPT